MLVSQDRDLCHVQLHPTWFAPGADQYTVLKFSLSFCVSEFIRYCIFVNLILVDSLGTLIY